VGHGPPIQASAASRDRAATKLRSLVRDGDVAISGRGGNQRTYDLAAELAGLCPDSDVVASLLKDIWNPACQPPWEDEEIDTFVANAFHYRQDPPGNKDDAGLISETFAGGFGLALLDTPPTVKAEKPKKQSRFMILHEKDMDNRPEPTWIIKDLIPDDSVCLWLGASQTFKSFLLQDAMLGVAAGTETFGDIPDPGVCLYAALEDMNGVIGPRRKAWKSARGITDVDNFRASPAPRIEHHDDIDEWMDEIERDLKGARLRMVAIDTAGKAIGGQNENESAVVRQFWSVCDALRERFGCTVVAVHHSGKDASRGARGSSAWQGDFDTIVEVKRPSMQHLNVEVTVTKHKNAADGKKWMFKGRQHAGSLVFDPMDESDFKEALEETTDTITPKKVGKLLASRKAHTRETALSTSDVWIGLGDGSQGRITDIDGMNKGCRQLERMANNMLRAYCEKDDKAGHYNWFYHRREK
jgi:hypothetical protein